MRIGTWNDTSLYRIGAVTLVARELAKYRLDLVAVQEVKLDGHGISPIGEFMLYYGKGNNNHQLGTGVFVHNRIKSAVKKWEDNIKMDLMEVGCDPGEWIDLAEDRDQWRAYVRAVMNLRVP